MMGIALYTKVISKDAILLGIRLQSEGKDDFPKYVDMRDKFCWKKCEVLN